MRIGLLDADLLCNGTRHPNLALLKIAGYLKDNGYVRVGDNDTDSYELITDNLSDEELSAYDYFYVACVFTFTFDNPPKVLSNILNSPELRSKACIGGTGTYANLSTEEGFTNERNIDINRLNSDAFLNTLKNKSGTNGIDMRTQMPDYHLYDDYIAQHPDERKAYYKDYKESSIGFMTRGCFRHCPFCVNKLENRSIKYSQVSDFLDNEIDEATGKLKRPYIYLWDDNFLACPQWEEMLDELIATKRPFQFRQGLDIRIIAQNRRGVDMAKKLSTCKYHGDMIFAFDNWSDRKVIEKGLKIWKHHFQARNTKLYLFCGFEQSPDDWKKFQQDIAELFMRIRILMKYRCLPYVMRHEDYKNSPMPNMYVQIARWCNQPGFFRNMSFWEFCYKNQLYQEGHKDGKMKTFDEFMEDYENGLYNNIFISSPIRTAMTFLERFPCHKRLFLNFFNMTFSETVDKSLWVY